MDTITVPIVDTWRVLSQRYHVHHFICPHCIAAGQGFGQRCSTGLDLWNSYLESLEAQP